MRFLTPKDWTDRRFRSVAE